MKQDFLPSRPFTGFFAPLRKLFTSKKSAKEIIPELEELLLSSDVGVQTTELLIEALKTALDVKSAEDAYAFIKKLLIDILTPKSTFSLPRAKPAVFVFVGVNGTGKTTTLGKLAHYFKNHIHSKNLTPPSNSLPQGEGGLAEPQKNPKMLLVAADTFRAAAPEQLKIWADRNNVDLVMGQMNADPASVAFDGIKAAISRGSDIVLIDTAGRLQTKISLMEELKKMIRIIERENGRPPDEIFLILDSTTGQNGLSQAKIFQQAVPLTGIILTKFDGTSKGGILLSVVRETGLPLRFVGVGEGMEDLKPFDAREFAEAMFE